MSVAGSRRPDLDRPGTRTGGPGAQERGGDSGHPPAATIRAGFSDARFYRERGIPSIGYGVTAHNGAAPDEYVEIEDLWTVCAVHTLTALDYLNAAA